MTAKTIAVLGAGIGGLAAALALARDDHRVALIERDEFAIGEPTGAVRWRRIGAPQFLQPHAFTPRGRRELVTLAPDVLDALFGAGAWDLDLRPKIVGQPEPGDDELAYVGVRRPLIEWALRRAVAAEPSITITAGARATGLDARPGPVPRVLGVLTTKGPVAADLVVDAMGRRTAVPGWIADLGGRPMRERVSECGIIYYCRYYQLRSGTSLPESPSVPGPRGDLGYGAFSTFPGDNGTFAAIIAIPPGDQALKVLRFAPAFEAAAATMPALHAWTNRDTAEPITDVLAMGSLQNVLRTLDDDQPPALGLVSVGDAICHTDPVMALGLSFGILHARLLAGALRDHVDVGDAVRAFYAAARPDTEERFGFASALDEQRTRYWAGADVDFVHRNGGAYALFTWAAGAAAATRDGSVFRRVVRRNTFLEPLSTLDDDEAMQQRIEQLFGEVRSGQRPAGPPRADLIAAMRAATASSSTAPSETSPVAS